MNELELPCIQCTCTYLNVCHLKVAVCKKMYWLSVIDTCKWSWWSIWSLLTLHVQSIIWCTLNISYKQRLLWSQTSARVHIFIFSFWNSWEFLWICFSYIRNLHVGRFAFNLSTFIMKYLHCVSVQEYVFTACKASTQYIINLYMKPWCLCIHVCVSVCVSISIYIYNIYIYIIM